MKPILLVNPGVPRVPCSKKIMRYDPPGGLLAIASYMIDHGFRVEWVDLAVNPGGIDYERIRKGEFLCVGMGVLIGEILRVAIETTFKIKEANLDMPVVWGGVIASTYAQEVLESYPVDFCVRYEGERTFEELCSRMGGYGGISFSDIKGLSYQKTSTVKKYKEAYTPKHSSVESVSAFLNKKVL